MADAMGNRNVRATTDPFEKPASACFEVMMLSAAYRAPSPMRTTSDSTPSMISEMPKTKLIRVKSIFQPSGITLKEQALPSPKTTSLPSWPHQARSVARHFRMQPSSVWTVAASFLTAKEDSAQNCPTPIASATAQARTIILRTVKVASSCSGMLRCVCSWSLMLTVTAVSVCRLVTSGSLVCRVVVGSASPPPNKRCRPL
mmetsp:Transcript_84049/g.238430  ORF Transcript_84049/g.238430 Transcript_84049/m.238430 type:complete len:201 (-) Transcript_84049:337-939(-)